MKFAALASGSKGNCYAFWNAQGGLLVDVGLSYKDLRKRFDTLDLDPWWFQHLLISHYHGDHVGAIRKWVEKHGPLVHAHADTIEKVPYLRDNPWLAQTFEYRAPVNVPGFCFRPLPVIHDTPGAVTFMIEDEERTAVVAMILETGRVTAEMQGWAERADALIIEANHDPQMVTDSVNAGDIPPDRAQRILATHLRNATAARAIAKWRPKVAVLAHLSADRNDPDVARRAVVEAVGEELGEMDGIQLVISTQDEPTEVIDLSVYDVHTEKESSK